METKTMRIKTAGKSAWRAVYIYGNVPNKWPIGELRFSLGIDSGIGSGLGKPRVFGQFGRWTFGFYLPTVSFLFAYRHKWAMPIYRLNKRVQCAIDARY